jgi:hypothetical protein
MPEHRRGDIPEEDQSRAAAPALPDDDAQPMSGRAAQHVVSAQPGQTAAVSSTGTDGRLTGSPRADVPFGWASALAGPLPVTLGRSHQEAADKIGEQSIRIDASKTGRTRYVKLLAPPADDLAERKAMAEPIGLVFPTAKGGPWTISDWKNWTRRVWRPAPKAAGLEGSQHRRHGRPPR